jgi:hypothetical protein
VATPRDGVVFGTYHQLGPDTSVSQTVINPKAINTQPITIDHSGDPALETSGVVLQQESEPFEFGREFAMMKVIDPLDEVVASLDRWTVVPNDMKTRFDIRQLHRSVS